MMNHRQILLCSAALLLSSSAHAGSLTPWGTAIDMGSALFTQYAYAGNGSVSGSSYINPGLGNGVDLIAGAGFSVVDGTLSGAPVEFIPRYFFIDSLGVAVRAGSTDVPGVVELGPELHGFWGSDRVALSVNTGWRPTIGAEDNVGSLFAVVAPELVVSENLSLYVEVNPAIGLAEDSELDLTLVPGVTTLFGPHGISLGVLLPTADLSEFSFGAWYGFGWGG